MKAKSAIVFGLLVGGLYSSNAFGQTPEGPPIAPNVSGNYVQMREDQLVNSATNVLHEVMALPAKRIPYSLLSDAQGVAIIPNVVKGGFVVGVRYGKGVLLVRDQSGAWHAPMFIELTGGSVGWQAGVQSTDVILVFKSQKSIDGIMRGKFTIGADASVAAGPVGREASAATDARLQAEIYSYSRSRGLFAGVSLGGSALQIDQAATNAYYGGSLAAGPTGSPPKVPASAVRLVNELVMYTEGQPGEPQPAASQQGESQPAAQPGELQTAKPLVPVTAAPMAAASQGEALKQQLAASSQKLFALLDDQWKQYLALPKAVYEPKGEVPFNELVEALEHYNKIFADAQFKTLSERPEFTETRRLLQEFMNAQQAAAEPAKLSLPAPPM